MAEADRDLMARWRDVTRGPLLDAGCGPGHWANFLHEGDRAVVGIDLSEEFIAHARATYPGPNFLRGDFARIPARPARFGGVLAWYSLIHTHPDAVLGILREFTRVMRPGGSVLIGYFHGPSGRPFDHAVAPAYYWSTEDMAQALQNTGFTVLETHRRQDPGHRPHAAVMAHLNRIF